MVILGPVEISTENDFNFAFLSIIIVSVAPNISYQKSGMDRLPICIHEPETTDAVGCRLKLTDLLRRETS